MTPYETIQGIVRQLDKDSRAGRLQSHGLPVPVIFDDCVDLSLVVKSFVSNTPIEVRGYWQRIREISNDGTTAEHAEKFLVYGTWESILTPSSRVD